MSAPRTGMIATLALMIGAPALTLVATGYQMLRAGGDGMIRPARVSAAAVPQDAGQAQAPAAPPAPAAPSEPAAPSAPAPGASPQGAPQAPQAAAPAGAAAEPVPGRSAQDFSAYRAPWEASLAKADPEQGRKLAAAGRPDAGVQACIACHGQQGVAAAGRAFPNLAGLRAEYIAKQLTDYRDGSRSHPLMQAIAKGLSEDEVGQLAAYYGSLPAPPIAAGAAGPEQARKLDTLGENARALPACANCHGLQGRGEGVLLPRLAGQPKSYFIDQMSAFRQGRRQNDDAGVMRAFAQRLTAQEIDALGSYYAGMAAAPR